MSWVETGKSLKNNIHHELYNLKANAEYQLLINGKPIKKYTAGITGIIRFDCPIDKNILKIQMIHKWVKYKKVMGKIGSLFSQLYLWYKLLIDDLKGLK